MSTDTFRGRLGEQTYTDPALFALDIKAEVNRLDARAKDPRLTRQEARRSPRMDLTSLSSGKLDRGRTPAAMTALTKTEQEWLGVYVKTLDGRRGQVWAIHPWQGYLWVLIEGETFAIHKSSCTGIRGAEAEPLDVIA